MSEERPQPKDGDRLLQCVHLVAAREAVAGSWHWFKVNGLEFKRVGSPELVKADWIVLCAGCFSKHRYAPDLAPIAGDGVWNGNDPLKWNEG